MEQETVKGKVEEVKEKVADVAHRGKEKARELYDNVKDKLAQQDWHKVKESTTNYIRNHPERAIGAALVAGFLLGYLIRRKSD
ncbi:MAG TPA: hypothetical protein PK014_04430 [Thermoanaerobaculia bacterium]|nr:hypothetical protein [Thermoanaerobaculia bacterium]HUM29303.1 hypothetical protein [Thermoanaerobaculia bacterium]HXK67739.1 hypothetical protein [Thermoanaerobaculia bacterium]